MGREPPFCLLYDETVNFGSKSRLWNVGGNAGRIRGAKKSLDLKSVLSDLFHQTHEQNLALRTHRIVSDCWGLRGPPNKLPSLFSIRVLTLAEK